MTLNHNEQITYVNLLTYGILVKSHPDFTEIWRIKNQEYMVTFHGEDLYPIITKTIKSIDSKKSKFNKKKILWAKNT